MLLAVTVAVPLIVSLAVAAHFWSTAGRFASYRPAEPSRLYAAPLVLRVGGPVDLATLVADLRTLGYRRTSGAPGIGEMRVGAEGLKIGLRRDARVAGGSHAAVASTLDVLLDSGRVRALRADGRALGGDAAVSLGRPLLYTYYDAELRECRPLRLDELPRHVVDAVIAAEDSGFFRHPGVAPVGILRAAWEDVRAGEVRQGGSTITQQLVKNLYVGNRRTLGRKLREAVLAMLIEVRFPKDRILAAYLNEIYWGSAGGANLHGLGAAARGYFGKEPDELTLAEAATLAGMIQSPAENSPLVQPAAARQRRDWVLARMAARRWVSPADAAAARAEPLVVAAAAGRRPPRAVVRRRHGGGGAPPLRRRAAGRHRPSPPLHPLVDRAGDRRAGGSPRPAAARAHVRGRPRRRPRRRRWCRSSPRAAASAPGSAAATGSAASSTASTQARRQAGSAFKPIVYAAALADGRLRPWEMLRDSPVLVQNGGAEWRPRNYDGTFHGDVTPAQALAMSLNVPAVRVAVRAGLPRVAELGHAMGIASPLPEVPSLALGSCEVTPLELATAYATLAGAGRRPAAWGLEGVVDARRRDADGRGAARRRARAPRRDRLRGRPPCCGRARPRHRRRRPRLRRARRARRQDRHHRRPPRQLVRRLLRRPRHRGVGGLRRQPPAPASPAAAARCRCGAASSPAPSPPAAGRRCPRRRASSPSTSTPTTGLLATPLCPRRVRQELPFLAGAAAPLRRPRGADAVAAAGVLGDTARRRRRRAPASPSSSPAPRARGTAPVHGEVTRLVGEGTDIRIDRGDGASDGPLSSPHAVSRPGRPPADGAALQLADEGR